MNSKKCIATLAVAALAILLMSSSAVADNIDFTCALGGAHCSGTVVQNGSNFSTTGIDVFNDSGPYPANIPFILIFDTSTGTISIDGTGAETGQDLIGTITSFSSSNGGTTASVSFSTFWPTLPAAVQAKLGSPEGTDSGFVIYLKSGGAAQSVDVLITPVPEPASLSLLGAGLFGLGAMFRRRRSRRGGTTSGF